MTDKVKANWLIIEVTAWEGGDAESSTLVLNKTFDEVLPMGLLEYLKEKYADAIVLYRYNDDGKTDDAIYLIRKNSLGINHWLILDNKITTPKEVFAILDAHYGRDVWLAKLDNDARKDLVKQGWLDD